MSDWAQTACILCECNCGIEVQLDGRRLERIRGDKAHPGSQGYTCKKAMRLDHYQNGRAPADLAAAAPADGSFEEIDWDTAIAEVAARLRGSRDAHGGETIFYYGGGGQGNHLGGSYSGAFLRALGSKYRSSALAQEKTGEFWVEHSLYGSHTRGDFEHAEVAVFVGKNPWQSQSFPRARVVLKEISQRSGAVDDRDRPRRTETAELADFHLRVRPGTDAWCLAAMVGGAGAGGSGRPRVPRGARERCRGRARALRPGRRRGATPTSASVDEALIRAAARRIAGAESVSVFEDLGIQQGPNSTLCSYLNRLLWILTGNFGNPGGMHLHTSFVNLFRDRDDPPDAGHRRADPRRARALQRDPRRDPHRPPEALPGDDRREREPRSLARRLAALARGVRGARPRRRDRRRDDRDRAPRRLRAAGREPVREGRRRRSSTSSSPTTPSTCAARCSSRCRARCPRPRSGLAARPRPRPRRTRPSSRRCARPPGTGRQAYAEAFAKATTENPMLSRLAPYVLYETLGPTLPDGLASAAALWGLAHRCAMTYPDAVRRAGHADGNELFDAILDSPSGVTFTRDEYGRRLRADRAPRQADRARAARDARRARDPRRRARASNHGSASRSCCPSGSAGPSRPTTSSATRAGASATPTGPCG